MCGLAATQLRAGAARLFYGTCSARLISEDSTGVPTGAAGGPDLVGPGRLTRYAIGTTAWPLLGGFPPDPYWDGAPSRGLRHSTRRAPRPFRGSGPEQRISELMDSEADGCWRTKRSDGT